MSSVLLTVLTVGVCAGMLVIGNRLEPHWVSKDKVRFLTTSEEVDRLGNVIGRRREVRGSITADRRILVRQRGVLRSTAIAYVVQSKAPRPPAGKVLYVLRAITPTDEGAQLMLRVPATSELVTILDSLGTESNPAVSRDVSAPPPDP